MRSISNFIRQPQKKGRAKTELQTIIEDIMVFMGDAVSDRTEYNKRFRYWIIRTQGVSYSNLRRMLGEARHGRVPQALFNALLKKEKQRLKEHVANQDIQTKTGGEAQ